MAYLIAVPAVLLLVCLCFLATFLFSHRSCFCKGDDISELYTEIAPDKWPQIKGHRVWPITILLFGWLIYSLPKLPPLASRIIGGTVDWASKNPIFILGILVSLVVLALRFLFLFSDFPQKIVWPYLKAKKEKICPYVEFVD